eukprot:scaffold2645_cov378-Prasinococcus_capsulatus_cf.AAC.12
MHAHACMQVRHTRNVGEDLVPKTARGPRRDKRMYLGGGSHAGLACKVLEDPAPSATKVRVALLPSDEAVRVKIKYLGASTCLGSSCCSSSLFVRAYVRLLQALAWASAQ